ncbi:MAG: hypothetical protein ACP5N1_00710 [Candidatus Woesearchaeota archaeon]
MDNNTPLEILEVHSLEELLSAPIGSVIVGLANTEKHHFEIMLVYNGLDKNNSIEFLDLRENRLTTYSGKKVDSWSFPKDKLIFYKTSYPINGAIDLPMQYANLKMYNIYDKEYKQRRELLKVFG